MLGNRETARPSEYFMIDRFIADSQLVGMSDNDMSEQAQRALCDAAEAFIRSGLPYEFWAQLSIPSKAAFVAANELIWKDRLTTLASLIGIAMRDEVSALMISDPQAAYDLLADKALDRFVDRLQNQKASA